MPGTHQAIIGAAAVCSLATGASASPVSYACELAREGRALALTFDLDPASFAPPMDEHEPPHRQVSRVMLNGATFEAEAVLTEDGTRGFHAPERGLMLTMARGGETLLSEGTDIDWRGRCREM